MTIVSAVGISSKKGHQNTGLRGFDTGVGHQIRKQPGLEARFRTDKKRKKKKAQKHNGLKNEFPNPSFLIFKISQSIVKFLV